MSELQEYKCPCCGGAVVFDSGLQKMKCPYCDTEFDVAAFMENDVESQRAPEDNMAWDTEAGSQWQAGEQESLRAYTCKSCGGQIVGDATMAATACPYCGNKVVIAGQFSGDLRPDYVIPFQLDKRAATEALFAHLKDKTLLPKTFKDKNHIEEVKGVYVPFWLFDADVQADVRYRTTRVRSWSDSDYDYIKTSYYAVRRAGNISFERVPVDGATKMPDALMQSIEPYDFSGAVPFQTPYLAGYVADKYDVNSAQSQADANLRIKRSTEDAFRATVQGYATVETQNSSISFSKSKASYALYPVWLLNTTWEGNQYVFAMNGQTGAFAGDLPVDKRAAAKWLTLLTVGLGAGIYGLVWLIWLLLGML